MMTENPNAEIHPPNKLGGFLSARTYKKTEISKSQNLSKRKA